LDQIHIKDLAVRCLLGIKEEERRLQQDVLINISLCVDCAPAGRSDDFQQAVDYRAVKQAVYDMASASQFYLIEALAERIAALCLEHPKVAQVRVQVEKPAALRFTRTVAVEITRARE
jgi:D-erythro-7,8-dihydroneopterin triphosphate epimerase